MYKNLLFQGGMLETISEQLFLLKESIQEADKLREWYHTNFIELESQKRDLEDLLSVSDEMVWRKVFI